MIFQKQAKIIFLLLILLLVMINTREIEIIGDSALCLDRMLQQQLFTHPVQVLKGRYMNAGTDQAKPVIQIKQCCPVSAVLLLLCKFLQLPPRRQVIMLQICLMKRIGNTVFHRIGMRKHRKYGQQIAQLISIMGKGILIVIKDGGIHRFQFSWQYAMKLHQPVIFLWLQQSVLFQSIQQDGKTF